MKKAQTSTAVSVAVILITFFVYILFFRDVADTLSTQSQDFACRSLTNIQDGNIGELANFLSLVKQRCFVDDIILEDPTKEEVFTEVGDEMARCWYRYGEGKNDFLSAYDTQGAWCFVCGKISFEDSSGDTYAINEFVDWAQDQRAPSSYTEQQQTYYDFMNFKYTDVEPDEVVEIREALDDLMQAEDSNFKELAFIFGTQYEYLQNLRGKRIDTNEEVFVVYRFDRIDGGDLDSALKGAAIGAGAGLLAGITAETILWGSISALSCTATALTGWTGIGALVFGSVCGTSGVKTSASVVRAGLNTVEASAKLADVTKVASKLGDAIKSSKKTNNIASKADNIEIPDTSPGKLRDVAEKLREKNPELADEYTELATQMDAKGLNSIDDLEQLQQLKIDELETLRGQLDKVYLPARNYLKNAIKVSQTELDEIAEMYVKLQRADLDTAEGLSDLQKFTRKVTYTTATGAVLGGAVGSDLDFDENQYVDVMTKEEFYRVCGTEPLTFEN